ncbi:hypothetical protein RM550_13880 [Streptomyces sp. DSM 41527]|uniref:Uncharacterized protein n=1 Tax=Streptomyces mooreae TaxID=3075523 RepID=A0ABU2T6G8_9ACTN|nr:hypothetical protein [Streptomyces sp. DSM 41527]MDT0456812.1 hypothetical protein [Streptomyces sp. DSM 41527]
MEEGRPLTAREFFAALAAGYQLPKPSWADEEPADNSDAEDSTNTD